MRGGWRYVPALAALVVSFTTVALLAPATGQAASRCDFVAAPGGSDRAPGTYAKPFASVRRLSKSLKPGEIGCLRAGVYHEELTITTGGRAGRPITITSWPGETAEIYGRVYLPEGENYIDITDLTLDGVNAAGLPSPTVDDAHSGFIEDDITNEHTAICLILGDSSYGAAVDTTIERNRIHDCGVLPPDNHEHGIYDEDSRGVRIAWNLIDHNADRGIQLYPDAEKTEVTHNIVVSNGEGLIFGGDGEFAASDDTVKENIFAYPEVRHDIESHWENRQGTGEELLGAGNRVEYNCVYGASKDPPDMDIDAGQIVSKGNIEADPEFLNAGEGDYEIGSRSACKGHPGNLAANARFTRVGWLVKPALDPAGDAAGELGDALCTSPPTCLLPG